MKNKNIIKIVIIVVISLIVIFFGYKGFMFYRYTFEKPADVEDIVKGLKNQSTMNIKKNVLDESEYITIDKFKIKNVLDGYTEDENHSKHVRIFRNKVDNNESIYQFTIDFYDYRIIDAFTKGVTLFGDSNIGFLKGDVNAADGKDFLEKNNIKNDIDFYKFVADNYFIESNIFTDTKTLKQNYAFNLIASISTPKIDRWTILEGDITGYIMNIGTKEDKTVWQISVLNNDKWHHITTTDSRFKDDTFLKDFVGSIEIIK